MVVPEELRASSDENVRIERGDPTRTVIIEAGESGKKRIVKKTVRIVKRIVRKKVSKPVSKSGDGNEEVEKDVRVEETASPEVSTSKIDTLKSGDGEGDVTPSVEDEGLKKSEPLAMDVENGGFLVDAVPENVSAHGAELTVPESSDFVENQYVGKEGVSGDVTPYVEDEELRKSEPLPMEVEIASVRADAVPENEMVHGSELSVEDYPLEVMESPYLVENNNVGKEGISQDDAGVSENEESKIIEDWRLCLVGEAQTGGCSEEVNEESEKNEEGSDKAALSGEAQTRECSEELNEEGSDKAALSGEAQTRESSEELNEEGSDKAALSGEDRSKGTSGEVEALESYTECSDKVTLSEEARAKGTCEEVKEVLESDVDCSDRVMLSEEMEALERKRRRRTQIFIGGLDKEATEEDIRKVFEAVGEVVEVCLVIDRGTGKNRGFAFLRFASAADAKKAVAEYSHVEICGKRCGVSLVEGNDTIFLGKIDRKWKTHDITKLLGEGGIDKIDKITVMDDPSNAECNRGFAFVEFETSRDAQIAFNKLKKKNVFGKNQQVRVAWAQPLVEPDEEEIQKVKSVYAEYLPPSWDEAKVTDYFKRFGEIESVALAKDLQSSRRKDFAFINYTCRESALSCVMAFKHEQICDDSTGVKVKVSLARPMPKSKQSKQASHFTFKEPSKEMRKAPLSVPKAHKPIAKEHLMRSNYGSSIVNKGSSSTNELLQILRQQASTRPSQPDSSSMVNQYPLPGSKRPVHLMMQRDDPLHYQKIGFPRTNLEHSFPIPNRSVSTHALGAPSVPHYHFQGTPTSEPVRGVANSRRPFQTQEQTPYGGPSGIYRRY